MEYDKIIKCMRACCCNCCRYRSFILHIDRFSEREKVNKTQRLKRTTEQMRVYLFMHKCAWKHRGRTDHDHDGDHDNDDKTNNEYYHLEEFNFGESFWLVRANSNLN